MTSSNDYVFYFALAGIIFVCGVVYFFWKLRDAIGGNDGKRPFSALFNELEIVFAALLVIAAMGGALLLAALHIPEDLPFLNTVTVGFVTSLLEDMVVFLFLGLVLMVLQRSEFYRSRKLDDRINYLFNAKNLTSEELTYLKDELATIACDFREDLAIIDVKALSENGKLVKLDILRRHYVGNYLKERPAIYNWEIDLEPGPLSSSMRDKMPAMTVYPSRTTLYDEADDGHLIEVGEDQKLHEIQHLAHGDAPFTPDIERLEIKHGQVREYRSRFERWQRLHKISDDENRYEIPVKHHWDEMTIDLKNSLTHRLKITTQYTDDDAPTTTILGAGDHAVHAWSRPNVEAGGVLTISFEILDDASTDDKDDHPNDL